MRVISRTARQHLPCGQIGPRANPTVKTVMPVVLTLPQRLCAWVKALPLGALQLMWSESEPLPEPESLLITPLQ